MDGLAGGALHQVVDGAHDDGAACGGVEHESDVAEVGAMDAGEIWQTAGPVKADEFFRLVVAEVDVEKIFGGLDTSRAHIDGFEDAAIDGEQMGGKGELRLIETGDHQHFSNVPMIEHRVDGEIIGDLAEAGFETGLAPGTAHPGLGVADDAGGSISHAGGDQGLNGEIRGGGVTAGVSYQACASDALAAELGKSVDGLGEQLGRGVLVLVPARIGGGVAKAEGAAEIDDFGAGVEHGGREFHGNFRRRGEEHDVQAFGANGVRRTRRAAWLRVMDGRGRDGLILTVFEEDWLGVRVSGEEAEEFGAAVAAEANDACLIIIHCYE